MLRFAIKMMIGDRIKFLGILFGLIFSTFIITQQAGIFIGLMQRTYGFIADTSQPTIWVMDPEVQHVDDIKTMKATDLYRVQGIEGVQWAVPMYKGLIKARLPSGRYQICTVLGLDDASLIGGPPIITEGSIENLRAPNAVIVNQVGAQKKLSHKNPNNPSQTIPMQYGEVFEINDRRAQVMGFCKLTRTFFSHPVIYTTFSNAIDYAPKERNLLTFVLVHPEAGIKPEVLAKRIRKATGLGAYTSKEFKKLTIKYYMTETGIPVNFGVAVLLGFMIGTAIAGQTFYNFAHDNLRHFATLKAMGTTHRTITKMVLIQATLVAFLGWGIGIGLTALFGFISSSSELSFKMPWWLFVLSALSIFTITILAALISLRKILKSDPVVVFQQ